MTVYHHWQGNHSLNYGGNHAALRRLGIRADYRLDCVSFDVTAYIQVYLADLRQSSNVW